MSYNRIIALLSMPIAPHHNHHDDSHLPVGQMPGTEFTGDCSSAVSPFTLDKRNGFPEQTLLIFTAPLP